MPNYLGNRANRAKCRTREHATGSSRRTDPMEHNRLRGMALAVTTPNADKGPRPHTAASVTWPVVCDTLRQLPQPAARAREAGKENGTIIFGAACPLPARVRHLCKCRPIHLARVHRPSPPPPKYHWLPIAIDGNNRHEAGYVHCTIRGSTSPDEPAKWWVMGATEQWSAIYALAQGVDFDQELVAATKVTTMDTATATRQPLFLLRRWKGTSFTKVVQELKGRAPTRNGVLGMHS